MGTAAWSTLCAAQELSTSPSAAEVERDTVPALLTLPRAAFQPHVVRWWEVGLRSPGFLVSPTGASLQMSF
jgi:hypothetical protein